MRGSGVENPSERMIGEDEYKDVNYMTIRNDGKFVVVMDYLDVWRCRCLAYVAYVRST